MGSQHRKLMSDSINETSKYDCNDCQPYCLTYCYAFCSNTCPLPNSPYMYPPPPPPFSVPKISPVRIVTAFFSVVFLLVVCFRCYAKSLSNRRRRSSLPVIAGPIIDHPVERINTGGLQPSVIDLIAVRKYKRGEDIVEGTDCSVCLNEFKENETLRLLPNCSHVFHVPCIDTWIKSHTTCPMCRAPIVLNEGNKGSSKS